MPDTSLERDEEEAATASAAAGPPHGSATRPDASPAGKDAPPRPRTGRPSEAPASSDGTSAGSSNGSSGNGSSSNGSSTEPSSGPSAGPSSPEAVPAVGKEAPSAAAPPAGPGAPPAPAPAPAPVSLPERAVPLRPEVLWAVAAAACYGLTLLVTSDDLIFLAIPGLLGCVLLEAMAARYVLRRPSPGATAPYPTDGSDGRGAVKFLYATLLKRYLLLVLCFLVIMALPLVTRSTWATYLIPLIGIGLSGVVLATTFWFDQLRWVRQCARVINVYDFEYRSPVYGLDLWRNGRRFLVMGCDGLESPEMHAREPMGHPRWPDRIAEGAWFAGDEVFGGVLLVPGTGELMCMQPLDWDEFKPWRDEAGEERREKAKRAGLDRHSV